jgi:hypothetical protein
MDNIPASARRPIVRIIDALTNAECKITCTSAEELELAAKLLTSAGCIQHERRLLNIMQMLNIVSAEMNDIREQLVGIARAEAKMKARPEGA